MNAELRLASPGDQCALNTDGTLKDASEIAFYQDADSMMPLVPGPSNAPTGTHNVSIGFFC